MSNLPKAFIDRMAAQLGDELPAFLRTYEEPYQRGIRLNSMKPVDEEYLPDGLLDAVPWESTGYYLSMESKAGADILHEAGAWYLQEPSAMIPAAVLNAQPGERILDLCAAPGGKTTQNALRMAGQGTIVCNEPIRDRAKILSRNVERMAFPMPSWSAHGRRIWRRSGRKPSMPSSATRPAPARACSAVTPRAATSGTRNRPRAAPSARAISWTARPSCSVPADGWCIPPAH